MSQSFYTLLVCLCFVRKPSKSLYLNTYTQAIYTLSSLYILFLIMTLSLLYSSEILNLMTFSLATVTATVSI